ncbi:MAG: hypothetical protein H5U02_13535 [Clostridia bacterium]|nr:hypothetical protein [Clostridia bacterium]
MEEALLAASGSLVSFLRQGLDKHLDSERLARAGMVLLGPSREPSTLDPLFLELADYLRSMQRRDGGWVDVEETAWCAAYMQKMPPAYWGAAAGARKWLEGQRHPGGGWGRSERDQPRIPYTAWVAILLPELVDTQDLLWLEGATSREMVGKPVLTYKIALPLIAFWQNSSARPSNQLVETCISILAGAQNEDGGFGPWQNHPCGSDPWCTAVVSLSLLRYPELVSPTIIERALGWILHHQLQGGFWPYHYLDEGSALAYWALRELAQWWQKGRKS